VQVMLLRTKKREKNTHKRPEQKTTATGRREGSLRLLLLPLTPARTRTLHFPGPI
jgi:hypothetical protein